MSQAVLGEPMQKLPAIPKDVTDEDTIKNLLKQLEEDPDMLDSEEFSELSDEQLLKMYAISSQWSKMACDQPKGPVKEVVFASISNVRENYMKRFIVTGTTSFLYQMLYEFSVEENARSWTPNAPTETDPYDLDKLVERAETIYKAALQAKQSQTYYQETVANNIKARETREEYENLAKQPDFAGYNDVQKAQLAELDKFGDKEKMDEQERLHQMSSKYAQYVATHYLQLYGKEAREKTNKTREEAMKYKEVKEQIEANKMKPVESAGKLTMPENVAKNIIRNFLDTFLRFDASIHVRSGASNDNNLDYTKLKKAFNEAYEDAYYVNDLDEYGVDKMDPTHFTLEQINISRLKPSTKDKVLLSDINTICSDRQYYNTIMNLCRYSELREIAQRALADSPKYLKFLVPNTNKLLELGEKTKTISRNDLVTKIIVPQDFYHRLSYYLEVNHNLLRNVTEAIYPEKSDIDQSVAIWKYFSGTKDECKKEFDEHCKKFQTQTPASIYMLDVGYWSIVSNDQKNRENINIYNSNNIVLQRILDRHSQDAQVGSELLKNRIKTKKQKNIEEDGPDAEGLSNYTKHNNSKVSEGEKKLKIQAELGKKEAIDELAHLDELRTIIKNAEEKLLSGQQLQSDENTRYQSALREIKLANDMANVPEGSVAVDIWKTNKDGKMTKETIYTKAEI